MKKGFTLIELLGVIIIISLLVIIVFPSIINSVKNSSDKTDDLTLDLIYNASDLFISNHINDFPKKNGRQYIIELKDLVDEGLLLSPIKLSDSDDDLTNKKCIQVTYNDGYSYELKDSGSCEETNTPSTEQFIQEEYGTLLASCGGTGLISGGTLTWKYENPYNQEIYDFNCNLVSTDAPVNLFDSTINEDSSEITVEYSCWDSNGYTPAYEISCIVYYEFN